MITYNHEYFIAQAIESVLFQKCNFEIELLIGEDCSTDNTRNIVLEYQRRYPDVIKVITSKNNVGMMENHFRTLKACSGKYIAICEGDDYWIDENKLQKQVDYLEKNQDCSLCFHSAKIIRNNNLDDFTIHRPKRIPLNNRFSVKHIILGGGGFMITNSMVFHRAHVTELPEWIKEAPVGDIPLMLILALKGRIGYIDQIMSAYREMSSPTSWSSKILGTERRKNHHNRILKMWTDFDNYSEYKFHNYVMLKKIKNRWYYLKETIIRLIR